MKLSWSIHPREALTDEQVASMLRVHRSLYERVDADRFVEDLQDKDEVVLVTDEEGVIRGYTTLLVYQDAERWVLFSGDTGMERAAWGSSALQVGWLAAALRRHDALGEMDWLLLAGGPRTYRYLPVFFQEFWPRPELPTPEPVAARLRALATARYGERYKDGVVALNQPPPRPEHDLVREGDPHDAFFREKNPGWTNGDELVCLTRVSRDNLTDAGRRILRSVAGR